ncbi:hypothetical protein [Companilactobacillus kimchii]|uniref:Uncharacterized protein n=2 Tax=Companilactobacillus kimchii TaxID=2801452 RepID=A0A210P8U8_9LACO|nr:hypothetical protein [Companilactobacillus kimchii]KAE9558166.1 hypothetical protein ATN91_15405 [Companilactobacillus kimchii]OWF32925.1 hypothetical protein LKACC12383_01415 [Companilactobacillus kimchii]GEO46883.1 hypothetical protein LKI01_08820 [Companilactobacillus paralimentarius]
MLKFGKKLNYRPLLMSLFWALLCGSLFGFNISKSLGIRIAIIIFGIIFIGHYLTILPTIFNYWDSSDKFIRYNDKSNPFKRLLIMLIPKLDTYKVIDKKLIRSIQITGLPMTNDLLSSALFVATEGGFLYNLMVMIRYPVKVKLLLKNGQIINLNLSRDYVDHPAETIGKLKIFLNDFPSEELDLSPETKHLIY